MPNIRRNLHFKLDASCHHEASPRRLGCCRLAKTPPRCRFSKTCNAAASEKPAERSLEYSTYFFPSFRIYISISKQKIPDFPLLHFILARHLITSTTRFRHNSLSSNCSYLFFFSFRVILSGYDIGFPFVPV